MAGLPLKSGADFYNLEAARLRLHNLGADPTEVGAGLIYFNTSTGLNTSQKARLYTGSAWKTIAFSEDLDVASNADFLALKNKVDTLIGDGVDMDGIIESWKEVEAFLSGMSDTKSLMDLLNEKLGKSGGEIDGSLAINRFLMINAWEGYGSGTAKLWFDGNKKELQWQGVEKIKIGTNDILTSAGGTIEGGTDASPLFINTTANTSRIGFKKNSTTVGYLGFSDTNTPVFVNVNDGASNLLHSGNVGEYALKTDGSNEMTGALLLNHTNPRIAFMAGGKTYGSLGYFADGLKWYVNSENAYHTIAFTDSTVEGAYKLVTSAGADAVVPNANGYTFVHGDLWVWAQDESDRFVRLRNKRSDLYTRLKADGSGEIFVSGNYALKFGTANTARMLINSSGNVLIGTTEDNGAKLQVDGNVSLSNIIRKTSNLTRRALESTGDALVYGDDQAQTTFRGSEIAFQCKTAGARSMTMIWNDGDPRVGIGTNTPTEKLHVVGNLHVTGNIIADGEVSAGGAGEEGSASGSGAGAFHSESIAVGATQKTIAHGLGTDDIVVSIYEKDGVSGRWSIILTDVEIVDANNIIVSFGSATTVEHKVVIMGAVA